MRFRVSTEKARQAQTKLTQIARLDDARGLLTASFRIDRELGFSIFVAIDLVRFARLLSVRTGVGRRRRGSSPGPTRPARDRLQRESWATRSVNATVAAIRSALDEPTFAVERERGRALTLDGAVALALGDRD